MFNDISKLESASNEDLELLYNWLKGNKLPMNEAKTKSMPICTKSRRKILNSNDDKLNLLIRDRELESVDVIKYRGVHVDYSLRWKDRLKSVTSKVSRGMEIETLLVKLVPCVIRLLILRYQKNHL